MISVSFSSYQAAKHFPQNTYNGLSQPNWLVQATEELNPTKNLRIQHPEKSANS